MKTVLVLAALAAVALAGSVPSYEYKTTTVDSDFVYRQKKVFELTYMITQALPEAEYYKIGHDYDIEANINNYTNKAAVEEFLKYYHYGMLPKSHIFSVFYEKLREQAIALYHLFYYAKDFETFYKTAAWARVHLNEGLFTYAFTIAVRQRHDTQGIVLPAPYEIYPYFFVSADVVASLYRIKMQEGLYEPEKAMTHGIHYENDVYTIYGNYSGWSTVFEDNPLTYFTEDIGLNTYYYYFHTLNPFWMKGEELGVKERRGELYFFFYQQLLARYYMERLTNGLGEIPEFSWRYPIKTGYYPRMFTHNLQPFVTRNSNYKLQVPENVAEIEYLENYESQFLEYLQQGQFKAYNFDVNFKNSKSVDFVGNYWQSTADLYEKFGPRKYDQYYAILAHILLGSAPEGTDKYNLAPAALEHFETSLRDPMFFQLYKRIMYYFLEYKQYLEPYTQDKLHFVGVKISDVKVDKLVTFFDYFDFDATNAAFYTKEQFEKKSIEFRVRQQRLNNKPFNVNIEVKSDVATDAMVKIFLAPKYDSNGFPISLEDNWMNFYELDNFKYKLVQGKNSIVRSSDDFYNFRDDSVPTYEMYKLLESSKIPLDMSKYYFNMPERLMLPKGTPEGYPFQLFVMVYPYEAVQYEGKYKAYILDNAPFGYPFDRPAYSHYFFQPNMYFKDVFVYHQGESFFHLKEYRGHEFNANGVKSH